MELAPAQVEVHEHGLLAGGGEQLAEVHEGGGLALLGHRPRHQHDLAGLVLAPEDEGGAQVLVGLGDEVDVGLVVLRHRGQQVEVQVALDLLRVLDRVVQVVAAEHETDPEDEAEQGRRSRHAALVGPDRIGGRRGPLHHAHVVVADRGGDVGLVELLQEDVVEALGRLRLLLQGVELGRLAALGGGLRLLAVDGPVQLRLPFLDLLVLGVHGGHDFLQR